MATTPVAASSAKETAAAVVERHLDELVALSHSVHSTPELCFGETTSAHAVAEALRNHYIKNIEQSWITLGRQAAGMTAEALTSHLVELQIEMMKNYPVLLSLLNVPPASQARRELIRTRIAEVLISHRTHMSKATALRIASVVQQVSRGLLILYGRADVDERIAIIDEFKLVLTGYLVPKLKP